MRMIPRSRPSAPGRRADVPADSPERARTADNRSGWFVWARQNDMRMIPQERPSVSTCSGSGHSLLGTPRFPRVRTFARCPRIFTNARECSRDAAECRKIHADAREDAPDQIYKMRQHAHRRPSDVCQMILNARGSAPQRLSEASL